eukprot:6016054-Pyramimonas_sp.AAC.2
MCEETCVRKRHTEQPFVQEGQQTRVAAATWRLRSSPPPAARVKRKRQVTTTGVVQKGRGNGGHGSPAAARGKRRRGVAGVEAEMTTG